MECKAPSSVYTPEWGEKNDLPRLPLGYHAWLILRNIYRYLQAHMFVLLLVSQQRQKRIVRMLMIVVVLFAVCWLPYHILFLYMDFGQSEMTYDIKAAIMSTQWFIYSNSTCNPVVYAVFNTNYRREFSRMLRCRRNERPAVKTNQMEMGRKDVEKNISFTDSCVDDSVVSCVSTTAI